MAKITDKTVKSKYPPKQTNVTWIDTSQKPAVTKSYIDGQWVVVGGGVTNYEDIKNKPTINGVELDGNKTSSDLGVATSQQGVKADTAYQKPSSGIPQSDLSSDVQSQLNKHFKGWYNTLAELKAAHTAIEGDSAYVKDASPATTWSIYVYDATATTDNNWADSGTDADTSNVQTFASGEEVNEVGIDAEPAVNSENLVESGGVYEAIYGTPTMDLVGFGVDGSFYAPNWKVGDVMYNTRSKLLRRCKTVNSLGSATSFETVPYEDEMVYINLQDNKKYTYNGTQLVETQTEIVKSILEQAQEQADADIESAFVTKTPTIIQATLDKNYFDTLRTENAWIAEDGTFLVSDTQLSAVIPIQQNCIVEVANTTENAGYISFLRNIVGIDTNGASVNFAEGYTSRISISSNTSKSFLTPEDAKYLVVGIMVNGATYYNINSLKINGVEYMQSVKDVINGTINNAVSRSKIIYPFYVAETSTKYSQNYSDLISSYDGLVTLYSNILTKNELGATALGTKLYEYVLDTGNYNSTGGHPLDTEIEKPKILVVTGVHGNEYGTISATFAWFKDMMDNNAMLSSVKNGVIIKLIPCVNPDGFNANTRYNSNTVDLNRNCNWNWVSGGNSTDGYNGTTAADQLETQIVQDWLNNNSDAVLFLDYHNDWSSTELSYMYSYNSTDQECHDYKLAYLNAITKLTNYFIGCGIPYTTNFGYCTLLTSGGTFMGYSQNVGNITSLLMEIAIQFMNDTEYAGQNTVRGGAEILGNVLSSFYEKKWKL